MSPGLHPHQSASIALGFTFEKLSPNQSFSGSSAQMGHLPVSRNCRRWGLLLTGLRVMLGWLLVWVARVSITCHLSPLTAPAPPPALGPAFCSGPFSPEMKLQRRPLGSWPDLANKSAGRTFKCEFKMNDGFFSTASSHAVFGSHFAVTELLVHRKSKFSRASPFYLGVLPLQILIVLGSHLQVRADAVISRGPRSRRHHVPSLVNSERLMPGRSAVHVGRTQARKRGPAR